MSRMNVLSPFKTLMKYCLDRFFLYSLLREIINILIVVCNSTCSCLPKLHFHFENVAIESNTTHQEMDDNDCLYLKKSVRSDCLNNP